MGSSSKLWRICRTFWVISAFTLLVTLAAAKAGAQCPAITNHGWPQGSTVRYSFDSSLNEEQKRQIRLAAAEWSRANSLNNSRVTFVEDTSGTNFILKFQTGALAQGNPAVFTGTYDGATGTVKTGVITYDPNNTFPGTNILIADPSQPGYGTVVMKLILHEMGHLMGLDHPAVPANVCDQPDGATVMNYACGINDQGENIPTTVSACDQNMINSETIYPTPATPAPALQIDGNSVATPFSEGSGHAQVTITRTGDTTTAVSVNYSTSDTAGLTACDVVNGVASQRCDYAATVGTLRFAAGETTKTVFIPLVDDSYAEGTERFTFNLSNPSGATLGTPSTATIAIADNDTATGANPIDTNPFFVRQHYLDFLGREPDQAGFQGWLNILNNCAAGDTRCDRIEVSSGFFRSEEFQSRGYFIYRFYSASLGRVPRYNEFIPDIAKVSGFLSAEQLEANKVAFVNEFMLRPEFRNKYDSLTTPTAYVNALLQTAGLPNHPTRGFWIDGLTRGTQTRADVLRGLVDSSEAYNKFYTDAFVVMQYFGYLRRDPDSAYLEWIRIMNANNGDYRGMISGFINSPEYRRRFGP